GADGATVLQVTETFARYCAVTAFLLVQHTGVCRSIAVGGSPIAADLLPALARGEMIAGIGAAQLRRAGPPMLRAAAVDGGYQLDGRVPWVSGYGLMTHLALGAMVEGVGPLFFWVPFREAPGIRFSEPQDLAVMRAASTVSAVCEGLFVPQANLIGDDAGGYWQAQHGGALANPTAFVLGIGAASLDGLRTAVERVGRPPQLAYVQELTDSLAAARSHFYDLVQASSLGSASPDLLDALLDARVSTTRLVLRIAEAAIAAEGGGAHLRTNPAQRHLREAAFFLTVTVNPAAREALVLGM
ncbi:MAG: acyl-CoA dehydrogenase domain protein, partial [Chloroflexi bacterium]|nr:acyl-CoA dehydrogenase domain protein [Chloroflexota bacterium]